MLALCSKPLRRGQLVLTIVNLLSATDAGTQYHLQHRQHSEVSAHAASRKELLLRDSSRKGGALEGLCIMVAEDNNTNRDVLTLLLEQAHCRVVQAVNGVDALDKFNEAVHVVLMDVHMPLLGKPSFFLV